jgi:hypothetical protein
MDLRTFILWESAEKEVVVAKKMYIDVCEDLIAGILMSQIVYWHLPGQKQGAEETKLKVKKRNAETGEYEFWLAKGRADWYDEIRISPKQFDNAIKKLISKGFVEKKVFRFHNDPMVHVRVIWDVFLQEIEKVLDKKDLSDLEPLGYSPKGKNDIPQTVKTLLPKGEERFCPKGKNINRDYNKDYLTENTNRETNTNTNINLHTVNLPMNVLRYFKDKTSVLVEDSFDLFDIESFYHTDPLILKDARQNDINAINDYEYEKIVKYAYEQVSRPINNTYGLIKKLCNIYLSFKAENSEIVSENNEVDFIDNVLSKRLFEAQRQREGVDKFGF